MSKRIPFILGFLLLILAVWLQVTTIDSVRHLIERLENVAYDIGMRAHSLTHRKTPYKTSVVIVNIDDKSLDVEGRWPWPRAKLATLVDIMQAEGAVVIVFDMLFPEQEQNIVDSISLTLAAKKLLTPPLDALLKQIKPQFDNDAILAASLQKGDDVVGMSLTNSPQTLGVIGKPMFKTDQTLDLITADGYIGANPIIAAAAKNFGFIDVFSDDDGIIRRVPLIMNYQNGVYSSLALEAVRIFLLSNIKLITGNYAEQNRLEGIQLGETIIPVDDAGQVNIPFRGRAYTFPYLSATDVLQHHTAKDALAGKIVFVGATAIGLGDLKPTAIQNAFPGIEINATIADAILKNNFPYQPAWVLGAEVFLIVLLGLPMIFIFPFLGPRILSLVIIILPITLLYLNNWVMEQTQLIVSILIPMLFTVVLGIFNLIYGYLFETRRREHLKEMFGQYVPEKHIDEMLKSSASFSLYGEDRVMTVLFADIRNFTTISEGMSAEQLKEMLNAFFTPMTEIIFKNKGTIDKYIGDLIMAFWGAPLKDKRHAQHAIQSALQMQKQIEKMRKEMIEHQWPDINIGIGLNSGMMSVGDMGSKFRRNYTVLGDAVNLASRVESLTKYYGVKIIGTENTCHDQDKFVFRLLDRVRVKGKKNGVEIYEVICLKEELTPELQNELSTCQSALTLYFSRQFSEAESIFTQLKTTYPHVKLYALYLRRLQELQNNPPPADWDGIYTHLEK